MFVCLLVCLFGWLVVCLFGWLFVCLFGWLFVCFLGWLVGWLVGWLDLTGWLAGRPAGWLAGWLAGCWLAGWLLADVHARWLICWPATSESLKPCGLFRVELISQFFSVFPSWVVHRTWSTPKKHQGHWLQVNWPFCSRLSIIAGAVLVNLPGGPWRNVARRCFANVSRELLHVPRRLLVYDHIPQ